MKRIHPGAVTAGVVTALFGLLTACVLRHYCSGPTFKGPKGQTATVVTPKVNLPRSNPIQGKDLERTAVPIEDLPEGVVRRNSRAAGQTRPSMAARQVPTLAPPQDPPSLPGDRVVQGPRGQVVFVRVEAEGVSPAGD
jgi:Flp pilus assembly protein CpaB